jgi:hypothetical protein
MQQHVDFGGLPVEAFLLISDVADRLAGCGFELRRVDDILAVLVLLQEARRQANFAGNDHTVCGGKGFAGNTHAPRIDAGFSRLSIYQVHDFIGDAIANLVRMAFSDRLAGEEIIAAHAGNPSKKNDDACVARSMGKDNDTRIYIYLYMKPCLTVASR